MSLTVRSASPIRTRDPGVISSARAICGSMMIMPSPSASETAPPPPSVAVPTSGQLPSTAFSATSLRASAVCSIARISRLRDKVPYSAAIEVTFCSVGRYRLRSSTSPPRRSCALPAMPVRIASATDPTVPMAATPSISAPRNTRKRATDPRISRRAIRQARRQPESPTVVTSSAIGPVTRRDGPRRGPRRSGHPRWSGRGCIARQAPGHA